MSLEQSDYQKHLVLFVDDEEKTRKYFKRLFGDTFNILLASDGVEALSMLQENLDEIGLIVTDQRMPNETGVAFLEKAVKLKPSVVRILSTAFADIDAAIDSVNKGSVYRYITKPWDVADLELTLRRAMEFYNLHIERDELLRQKVGGVENMIIADRVISLAALAVNREHQLRHLNAALVSALKIHGAAATKVSKGGARRPMAESWKDFYRQSHAHLSRAMESLPADLTSGAALGAEMNVSAVGIISALASSVAGLQVDAATESYLLPGPAEAVQAVLLRLISSAVGAAGVGEKCALKETALGIECLLPAAAMFHALEPLFGNGTETMSPPSLQFLGGLIAFYHSGGTVDVMALADGDQVKVRLGFQASRINAPAGDSIEALTSDLIGNELFWSRANA